MNFLQRLFSRPAITQLQHLPGKVNVSYTASISFATDFMIHYYDEENEARVMERTGTYFQLLQHLPIQRNRTYFRIHVFNPKGLSGQTVTISIKVRNSIAVEKTFEIPAHDSYSLWYAVKANLI